MISNSIKYAATSGSATTRIRVTLNFKLQNWYPQKVFVREIHAEPHIAVQMAGAHFGLRIYGSPDVMVLSRCVHSRLSPLPELPESSPSAAVETSGSSNQKMLPTPGFDCTSTVPPRRSIDLSTIASPTPAPSQHERLFTEPVLTQGSPCRGTRGRSSATQDGPRRKQNYQFAMHRVSRCDDP